MIADVVRPRRAHKGPAHKGPRGAHKGPAHQAPGRPQAPKAAHKGPARKAPGGPQGPRWVHKGLARKGLAHEGPREGPWAGWGDALQQADSDAAIEASGAVHLSRYRYFCGTQNICRNASALIYKCICRNLSAVMHLLYNIIAAIHLP